MPSYLTETGIGRTQYRRANYSSKKMRGAFGRGFSDGVFNGWPGKWTTPAAPANLCYSEHPESQLFSLFTYTVGFYMGATESSRGPDVPEPTDAVMHQKIAQASVF